MVDAGRILFINTSLQNAAAQGARASALGATSANVEIAARAAAPGVPAMSGSGQTQIGVVINTTCPVPLNPSLVQMTRVTTSITYAWTTPLALIQNITPGQTRPGTLTLSASSEWLCGP
jgi:Flp pilus assembly protein TadG